MGPMEFYGSYCSNQPWRLCFTNCISSSNPHVHYIGVELRNSLHHHKEYPPAWYQWEKQSVCWMQCACILEVKATMPSAGIPLRAIRNDKYSATPAALQLVHCPVRCHCQPGESFLTGGWSRRVNLKTFLSLQQDTFGSPQCSIPSQCHSYK